MPRHDVFAAERQPKPSRSLLSRRQPGSQLSSEGDPRKEPQKKTPLSKEGSAMAGRGSPAYGRKRKHNSSNAQSQILARSMSWTTDRDERHKTYG
jgi:hypothetical protein